MSAVEAPFWGRVFTVGSSVACLRRISALVVVGTLGLASAVPLSAGSVSGLPHHAAGTVRISPPGQLWLVRGLDTVSHSVYFEDVTNHRLLESDAWGATSSFDKGLPNGVTSVNKVVRFRSKLYLAGRDAATRLVGVYSATPTPGPAPLRWSGPTITIRRPATVLQTDFSSDGRFLYLGEYGDPKPGPVLYRSHDGIHWTRVFGPAIGIRHIHAVMGDPYRPGNVWMTVGDGVDRSIWRSTRYGAPGSWHVVVGSADWQSAQISFDRRRVYFAADASGKATFFVVNRETGLPQNGTERNYQSIRPPGAPRGARYLFNAFFGAVDPSTGIYYCVADDESERGNPHGGLWMGFFAVRRIGGPVIIVDPGGVDISMNGEVFVGGGRIWSGQWSVSALPRLPEHPPA